LEASPFHDPGPVPEPATAATVEATDPEAPPVAPAEIAPAEIAPAEIAPAEIAPVEIDLNPAALRLTTGERNYLLGFHDLVTTPRATKRFLNTYQLLRSGIRDVDGYLAAEEYRPVLLLLALVTGTTLVTNDMVQELRQMNEPTFADFLASPTSHEAWKPLRPACADLPVELLTPKVVEEWCTRVARYSFHPVGR
jgi:hypothetical protein